MDTTEDPMGKCNHCTVEWFKRQAEKVGATIEIVESPSQPTKLVPAGLDVFRIKDGQRSWVAWMGAIPERCVC